MSYLKTQIKDAILDGIIPNERKAAIDYLIKIANEKGLVLNEEEYKKDKKN